MRGSFGRLAATSAILFSLAGANILMAQPAKNPIVIAHRGASGYLPEHSLAAKALAYGMGADFIEQDVVLTKDSVPVVLHDIHLDTISDVAKVFPDRARDDGRYYALDFELSEIKRLRLNERIDLKTGKAVFPGRYPLGKTPFQIPTLAEELQLIQGLNQSTGKTVGVYPEIKKPAWHREQGYDISVIVLKILEEHGYASKEDAMFLQCFDAVETKRIRQELGCQLRIVQLIGRNSWSESSSDYDQMVTPAGLARIAEYADGIGPSIGHILDDESAEPNSTGLVNHAHQAGLLVHPFTLRKDALPKYAKSYDHLLELIVDARVDGYFTDFPNLQSSK